VTLIVRWWTLSFFWEELEATALLRDCSGGTSPWNDLAEVPPVMAILCDCSFHTGNLGLTVDTCILLT
jgi:hypothetical protein